MAQAHNIYEKLATAGVIPTTGMILKTPEGANFGWGKTVPSSAAGWAPGAIFVHTDGAAGTFIYVNQGTVTSSTFTAAAVLAGLAATTTPGGAALVGLFDTGSIVTGTNVNAAIIELMKGIKTAQYTLYPDAIRMEDGTEIGKFTSEGAPSCGWSQEGNEDAVIRWNNDANPGDILAHFVMPQDLNAGADVILHLLGCPTSTNDSPVFTVEAYFATVGVAAAGDADCGGESSEFTAAATMQEETLTIANADVPASPSALTLIMNPKDGQLGTDDFLLAGIWLEVSRLCLTS